MVTCAIAASLAKTKAIKLSHLWKRKTLVVVSNVLLWHLCFEPTQRLFVCFCCCFLLFLYNTRRLCGNRSALLPLAPQPCVLRPAGRPEPDGTAPTPPQGPQGPYYGTPLCPAGAWEGRGAPAPGSECIAGRPSGCPSVRPLGASHHRRAGPASEAASHQVGSVRRVFAVQVATAAGQSGAV